MGTPKDSEITRANIIDAAGKLFAQKSYKEVSVREIIKSAHTHLSALNYHFGSKDALYLEVMKEACRVSLTNEDQKIYLYSIRPEKALFEIVKYSLDSYFSESSESWQYILLDREWSTPSNASQYVSENYLKPEGKILSEIIAKIVNKTTESRNVQFAAFSMIGLTDTFGLYGNTLNQLSEGLFEFGKKKNWFAKKITKMIIAAASEDED